MRTFSRINLTVFFVYVLKKKKSVRFSCIHDGDTSILYAWLDRSTRSFQTILCHLPTRPRQKPPKIWIIMWERGLFSFVCGFVINISFFIFQSKVDSSPLNDLQEQFLNSLNNLENYQSNSQLVSHTLSLGSKSFSDILALLHVSLQSIDFYQYIRA